MASKVIVRVGYTVYNEAGRIVCMTEDKKNAIKQACKHMLQTSGGIFDVYADSVNDRGMVIKTECIYSTEV